MEQLDSLLIEEAKQDPAAFGALVQRYQDRLFNYLYRMTGSREDAEDLAQEVLIRIYKALDRFRLDAPFKPWMYKIATNVAINHLKSRRPASLLEDDVPSTAHFAAPEAMAEQHETQRVVLSAINELPDHYRAIVLMRHLEELSYEEIAQALDVPLGTAKVRLHRARALLQEKLVQRGVQQGDHELQHRAEAPTTLS